MGLRNIVEIGYIETGYIGGRMTGYPILAHPIEGCVIGPISCLPKPPVRSMSSAEEWIHGMTSDNRVPAGEPLRSVQVACAEIPGRHADLPAERGESCM